MEMIAGVTLAVLAIPEVMGYSSIAGMAAITGLSTILLPLLAFAILGSSSPACTRCCAFVASIIDHLRRSYRPGTSVLQPGPLCYANANLFFEQTSAFGAAKNPPRWLCTNAAVVPDIDYRGGETIRQLYGELAEQDIKLVIADPLQSVRDGLNR